MCVCMRTDSRFMRERPPIPLARLGRALSPKPDPASYMRKGDGPLIKTRATASPEVPPSPPRAGATALRDNPPNR